MKIKDIRVLLVGLGNWGKNHSKTLKALPCKSIEYDKSFAIKDMSEEFVHPNPVNYDAVIIATTSSTHFELTKKYWLEGKHVLCEKPVVKNKEELDELVSLVRSRPHQVFMAGHTMLFNGAIEKISKVSPRGDFILRRMKYNPIDGDDEVYRLIPHDLSILDHTTKMIDKMEFSINKNFVKFQSELCEYKGNIQVSWWQYPPIRDVYVNVCGFQYYFNDYNEIFTKDGCSLEYDKTPPLLKEQMRFLELIAGDSCNNPVDISHTERVYTVLTNLKKWEPWTPQSKTI